MASVYVLYSVSADKYYIGSTKDLMQRFEYHLLKEFKESYTAKYHDWELYFEIPNLTIRIARKIESHIKKMKSRVYLENLRKHPEITKKLILKYKIGRAHV